MSCFISQTFQSDLDYYLKYGYKLQKVIENIFIRCIICGYKDGISHHKTLNGTVITVHNDIMIMYINC